jgi:N4-gp56 family major capsid protein
MAVQNFYGDETGLSTHGQNTIIHYYDKAGVKAANAIAVYAQWSDRRSMPLKRGKTYKVSKWLHIYDREVIDGEFATKGYLTARNIVDVSAGLDSATLAEGAGAVNKQSIKKVTIETGFARYGEMLDYTDEVEMFAEDMVQVHYREELGLLANRRAEDLIQLDMLTTTTAMYPGTAASMVTVGTDSLIADGSSLDGSVDELSRISYDLIRKGIRKLVRNRAIKNTSIVTGSTKIDTRTINKAFYAIIGPEIKYDLENVVRGNVTDNGKTEYAYVPAYKYADASNLAEGEVGAMNDARFIESESQVVYRGAGNLATGWYGTEVDNVTPVTTTVYGTEADAIAGEVGTAAVAVGPYLGDLATSVHTAPTATALNTFTGGSDYQDTEERFDVFPILFPTKGSFATVGLKGHGKIKFNAQPPSKIELSNPYGTQGFFSYNMWYSGIILREERLLKIMVCASA